MTPEQIARVCHEANKGYCDAIGDRSQVAFDDAPEWQRSSAIAGVSVALEGASPEQLHESWAAQKMSDGWVYGEQKDSVNKTHPCLVPYAELPEAQKTKDALFAAIVSALRSK